MKESVESELMGYNRDGKRWKKRRNKSRKMKERKRKRSKKFMLDEIPETDFNL
jgi:hypothetical protein